MQYRLVLATAVVHLVLILLRYILFRLHFACSWFAAEMIVIITAQRNCGESSTIIANYCRSITVSCNCNLHHV